MLLRRRSRRVAAAVGLVAGLALLLAAVLDGGMTTPTRADVADGASATVAGDPVATLAPAREDHPTWGQTVPSLGIAVLLAGLVALVGTVPIAGAPVASGPRHRAPALRAARHRGPPVLV